MNDYEVSSIKVLDDIGHVRQRAGMYVGATDIAPIALFNEAFDNALDESQNFSTKPVVVKVVHNENGDPIYSVRDYGRGIPIGKINYNNSFYESLELLVTKANSGAKFDNQSYKVRSGLNGVGLVCTNALSSYFQINTYRNGLKVSFCSRQGKTEECKESRTPEKNGVFIEFTPDKEIYTETIEIPKEIILNRCRIAQAMGYQVKFFYDEEEIEINADSIIDLFPEEKLSEYCHGIVEVHNDEGESLIMGFKYTSDTKFKRIGYTNLLPNKYGGIHTVLSGDVIGNAFASIKGKHVFNWDDSFLGCRIIIAAFISDASFNSQTKDKLTVPKKKIKPLFDLLQKEFEKWLKDNPQIAEKLMQRFEEYRKSQIAFQNQKDLLGKLKFGQKSRDGKGFRRGCVKGLYDCSQTKQEGTELFIVEGDSAAGNVAIPRDKKTQAVLPLRGKIQNCSGMSIKSALKHQTLLNIVNSLGCGVGETADPEKCRYERIIITTDSDDDGQHICALILTAMVNLAPSLVKAGMLYVLNAPLYKYFDKEGNSFYTSDFDSIPEWSFKNNKIIRFKGLGSMEDSDFKEACLNLENREMYQITYPDDIDTFNEISGTSQGRSKLLRQQGVIKSSEELEIEV